MSLRVFRNPIFQIEGDGSSSVLTIDLREHLESQNLVGGFSPSGVEAPVLKSNRTGNPVTINSISVANFIVTVTLAAALANDAGFGYNLTFTLLFEGAV